ncbi:Protein KES1, partial [Termitomyces sp. J132]
AVPVAQRSSWSSFLKSIASFSGDLSSLTAPPFILSPVSLTEFPAYWCEHPDVFAAIADAPDDEARVLAVLKWFIGTLKDQYTSRNESMGSEKKPLNPVLGELFYGTWPAPASNPGQGKTTLLVEQVSHHPPITAYVIENKSKGLRLTGHNAQKTSFSGGSIIVKQIGHAILTYTPPSGNPVEYLLTLPRLRIDGLWYGSPYIELTETTYIVGGGFVGTIEYKGRGYFSGKSHSFKAHVVRAPGMGGGGEEHVVEGTWHEKSKVVKGGSKKHQVDGTFHDAVEDRKKEVGAVGGEEDGSMGEFETRKLWAAVAKGIREGDFETASREKSRIENDQRQRRRDEVAAGTTWALRHFKRVENDEVYERLARVVPKLAPATEDCYVFQENWPRSMVE